jgi:hypothetical protein
MGGLLVVAEPVAVLVGLAGVIEAANAREADQSGSRSTPRMAGKVVASTVPSSGSTFTKVIRKFFSPVARGRTSPTLEIDRNATHHRSGRGCTGTAMAPLPGHSRGETRAQEGGEG